jgi:hypothetical protein
MENMKYETQFNVYIPHTGGTKTQHDVYKEYLKWLDSTAQGRDINSDIAELGKLPLQKI